LYFPLTPPFYSPFFATRPEQTTDTHEVVLAPGDLLFYESSKVFHGRPKRFKGSWYSSVFVHYYPTYGWKEVDHNLEKHYRVPPIWNVAPKQHLEVPLKMMGTGMKEPSCPNDWCQTEYAIKWENGSGEHGKWIAPDGEKFDFIPQRIECTDQHSDCAMWASWETDECKTNPSFMMKECKKSCKACTVLTPPGSNGEL
jgi:hypothetical protein